MWVYDVVGVDTLVQEYGFYGAQRRNKRNTHPKNRQTHITLAIEQHNSVQASCWAYKWRAKYLVASQTDPLGFNWKATCLVVAAAWIALV
jgi:hypothetical protein